MPPSLWTATAAPPPEAEPLRGEGRADVCVIGGGYTGLSAALHLAEAGAAVTVLEAGEVGFGASGRNGGQVIPGLKVEPDEIERRFGPDRGARIVELAAGTADFVFRLIERHGIACDARQDGWIRAAHSPAALRQIADTVRQWFRHGVKLEELDRDALRRLVGTQAYVGGFLDRRGGCLQPLSYARGLAGVAQRLGARIHTRTLAAALIPDGREWLVRTDGGTVRALQVIIATNAYSGLAAPRGLWGPLSRSVVPVHSSQAATMRLPDAIRARILPGGQGVSDTRRLLRYFRIDPSGRLIMGGRGRSRESSDPATYRTLMDAALDLFPELAGQGWHFFWSGQVALTADHLPHLHELAPAIFAGLGYNGRGVAMATVMGKLLADRAQGVPADRLPFPTTELRTIALHGLHRPVLPLVVGWKRLLDRVEGWRAASRARSNQVPATHASALGSHHADRSGLPERRRRSTPGAGGRRS